MPQPIRFAHVAKDPFPIFCELQRYRGSSGPPLHGHDCLELVYVIKGSGLHRIDGEPFPLIPGDLYAIAEGSQHSFTAEGELLFYNILVKLELFDERERQELLGMHAFTTFFQSMHHHARPKLSFCPPLSQRLAEHLDALTRECAARQPGWRLAAKALFCQFIIQACRPVKPAVLEPFDMDGGPVATAMARIHERYTEVLTVEDLAQLSGISAGHLGETFKLRTGLTIHQYLTKIRVDQVRAFLEETELSITAICQRTCFEESGYLTRVFKRITGVTPRAYRERCRANTPRSTVLSRGVPRLG
jgi:AraC-like DNA-binding protein/mannose-6-phosphate isomerase-like protein (cupin superfamily)